MPINKNGSNLALLCVCQVQELFMKLAAPVGPQPPMDPPHHPRPGRLLFSTLYTSMVTKNKFVTFPARLISPLAPDLDLI